MDSQIVSIDSASKFELLELIERCQKRLSILHEEEKLPLKIIEAQILEVGFYVEYPTTRTLKGYTSKDVDISVLVSLGAAPEVISYYSDEHRDTAIHDHLPSLDKSKKFTITHCGEYSAGKQKMRVWYKPYTYKDSCGVGLDSIFIKTGQIYRIYKRNRYARVETEMEDDLFRRKSPDQRWELEEDVVKKKNVLFLRGMRYDYNITKSEEEFCHWGVIKVIPVH